MLRALRSSASLALLGAALACARGPEPCASAGTCPEGQECLANRCVVAGGDPVPADSQRLVVEPERMAVVSAKSEPRAGEIPPAVAFGSRADGAIALYLAFPPVWRRAKHVEAAFLVLEPMPGTVPASDDVEVEAWRVQKSWEPDKLRYLAKPPLAPPMSAGIARSAPPSVLRIDVTDLVRYLKKHAANDHGLALVSGSDRGAGASFATGMAGGRAPRLEVYVR